MSDWKETGVTRLGLLPRRFRHPLIIIEAEWADKSYYGEQPRQWLPASLRMFTKQDGYADPREKYTGVRYRAKTSGIFFRDVVLVMQVCTDKETDTWRDARAEDLGDFRPK